MSMKYMTMMLGPVMTNCYIVYDSETKDAMVVDPAWDYDKINQALEDHQLHLNYNFQTHGHADHIGALQELRNRKNVPVYIGEGDKDLISNSRNNLSLFMGHPIECASPDYIAHEGDTITLAICPLRSLKRRAIRRAGLCLYGEASSFPATPCSATP